MPTNPRIKGSDAKAVLALLSNMKPPGQADIDRAAAASVTCKSTKEFCEFLELAPVTFNAWCKSYPSYRKAVWAWRDVATSEIEVAMAKRAIGFKKTTRRDVVTKTGQVETLINETYYPPDPTAAQFWLKNRAPNDWQDKKEIDVNVNANIRAWLVSAGGQLDPTETIDISPGSLIEQSVQEAVAAELEDHTQELLEGELVADLMQDEKFEGSDVAQVIVELAPLPTVELENNSPVSPAPVQGGAWQGLNGKWR